MAGVTPLSKWARKNARIRNEYVTGFIGEFLGNLVLCLFAVGAASTQEIHPTEHIVHVFGGVFGLMISVTAFGGLSGAHINPAVSLGLAMVGEMSWLKVPVYWVAQLFGSYVGAGIGYGLYEHRLRLKHCSGSAGDPLCDSDGNNDVYLGKIAGIFSPLPSVTPVGVAFADQVITTMVLFVAIMSAIDRRNMKVPTHLFGIFFALVVAGIAFAFGINAGGSMNPARDFGPRLMAVSIGCKSEQVFKSRMYDESGEATHPYWLAPLFGPMLGAMLGGLIYVFFVGSHLKETEDEMKKGGQGGQGGDSGDWRSTVFLPKANQPSGPQNGYGTGAPYNNNNVPPSGPYGNGVHNPGYVRDNPRPNY
jgi:MIP family channel proteins